MPMMGGNPVLNILWHSQKTNLYFAQCLVTWKLTGIASAVHKSTMVTAVLATGLSLASGLWGRNEVFQLALVAKNPCQRKRHKRLRFNPLVGKIPWRRAWQPTPVFLPGEFHEQRSLAGYNPWSHKESDTTKQLTLSLIQTLWRKGRGHSIVSQFSVEKYHYREWDDCFCLF